MTEPRSAQKADTRASFAVVVMAAAIAAASCRGRSSSTDADAGAPVDPIDAVYARYKLDRTWVDPDDLTKPLLVEPRTTGSFATCAHCDYDICYEELPIEEKLRIKTDADLLRMVRWLRDPDACIRRVAEKVTWPKLGLAGDGMSVRVQDREGVEYHALVSSLKAHVDFAKLTYDPKLFDGLMVSLTENDFPTLLSGSWTRVEDGTRGLVVEIGTETIRVMQKPKQPDPEQPDISWTSRFDQVRVNPKVQFEIAGQAPDGALRHYLFWPVTRDVLWLAYSNQGAELGDPSWTKMKRSR